MIQAAIMALTTKLGGIEMLKVINRLILWMQLKTKPARGCRDCKCRIWSTSGDGWNEPCCDDWYCPIQENQLQELVSEYEEITSEVDWEFATVCPKYQEIESSDY